MKLTRREIGALAAIGAATLAPTAAQSKDRPSSGPAPDRIDPWIEIDAGALKRNVAFTAARAGGVPIMAVVKCFAYGLDHRLIAKVIEPMIENAGFAVVTADEAMEMREAGIKKPVLLMDDFADRLAPDYVKRDITLSVFTPDAPVRLASLKKRVSKPIRTSLYIDTGFGRLDRRWDEAEEWVTAVAGVEGVALSGVMTEMTDHAEFDLVQIDRFEKFTQRLAEIGVKAGPRHASSTDAILNQGAKGAFDMVRPGNLLQGLPPDIRNHQDLPIDVIYRLKAKVLRVHRLEKGESTSYGRAFIADEPCDIAIIKCGRTEGYIFRKAGANVLIGGDMHKTVGGVSASHCYVKLNPGHSVKPGDVATMIGPETGIRPHDIARTQDGLGTYEGVNLGRHVPRYVIG